MNEKLAVHISKEIYEKAKKFVEEEGDFSSVEELVEFVLNEVLSEEAVGGVISKENEEKVKERLKWLGYI